MLRSDAAHAIDAAAADAADADADVNDNADVEADVMMCWCCFFIPCAAVISSILTAIG